MSVYSMTGYANVAAHFVAGWQTPTPPNLAVSSTPHKVCLQAECRAVNGRFLDFSVKLPDEIKSLEPALREIASAELRRGKVELRFTLQNQTDTVIQAPATNLLQNLSELDLLVRAKLPQAHPLSVYEVLQISRAQSQTADSLFFDSALKQGLETQALALARECLQTLKQDRAREGARLAKVISERVTSVREWSLLAEPLIPAVVQRQQERFLVRWQEAMELTGARQTLSEQALTERALNEAAAIAIRIDVAEELARLRTHLDEIERLIQNGGELGKRLDFLIQELHREANTLGSKSASIELTAISVDMKVAIEQMREQVQNIE